MGDTPQNNIPSPSNNLQIHDTSSTSNSSRRSRAVYEKLITTSFDNPDERTPRPPNPIRRITNVISSQHNEKNRESLNERDTYESSNDSSLLLMSGKKWRDHNVVSRGDNPNDASRGDNPSDVSSAYNLPRARSTPYNIQNTKHTNDQSSYECDIIYDYKKIMDCASNRDTSHREIADILFRSTKLGIIRNVRILLPVTIGNGLDKAIMDTYNIAIEQCHLDIVRLIENHGFKCDIDICLSKAISSGWMEMINYFIVENNANIKNRSDLLSTSCMGSDNPDVLKLLLDNIDSEMKPTNQQIQSLIEICIKHKSDRCAMYLIQMPSTVIPVKLPQIISDDDTYSTYFNEDNEDNGDNDDDNETSDYDYTCDNIYEIHDDPEGTDQIVEETDELYNC